MPPALRGVWSWLGLPASQWFKLPHPQTGISRDNWHKRRKTGGKRKPYHKKRKYELGRPAANTKVCAGPRRPGGRLRGRACTWLLPRGVGSVTFGLSGPVLPPVG